MTAQRYVLVAWPPSEEMVTAGWSETADPDGIFGLMCAATPIAADDPAVVEQVARLIDPHNINWDNGIDTMRKRELRDKAAEVLRIFTPERP